MSDTISRPDGAVAVHFKDEDNQGSSRIGPVYFIVETTEGRTYVPAFTYEGETDFMGNPVAGWMTSGEARRMAKHFDLPYESI